MKSVSTKFTVKCECWVVKTYFPLFVCPWALCSLSYAEEWKVVSCSLSLRYSWTCRLPSCSLFVQFLSNKSIDQNGKRKWEDTKHAPECFVFGKIKSFVAGSIITPLQYPPERTLKSIYVLSNKENVYSNMKFDFNCVIIVLP